MITYGDGVCNINIKTLLNYHKKNKKILTLTAVHPQARFGELEIKKNLVQNFNEKPQLQKGWINGGFFVAEPTIFKFLSKKNQMFEREPITKLVKKNLAAYKHENFWFCVDTLRDKNVLENIYKKNKKFGKFIIMNVLITGGSGYLGSIFAEKLHSDFSIICGSQKKILSKKKR